MVDKYKIIFLIKPSRLFFRTFWIFKPKSSRLFFRTLWIFKLKTLG